jgi:hypothetical protein
MYTKTKIKFSQDFKYVSINLLDIEILLDLSQFEKFNNDEIHWNLNKDISIYPYYKKSANIRETLLEYFYTKVYYVSFKNNNKYDLRKENCNLTIINNEADKYVREKYNVLEYFIGHPKTNSENKLYNMSWLVYDFNKDNLDKELIDSDLYYLMYCEKNVLIKLTIQEYQILQKYNDEVKYNLTWFHCLRDKKPYILSLLHKNTIFITKVIQSFNRYDSIIYINNPEINDDIDNSQDVLNNNINKTDIFYKLHNKILNKYKIKRIIKGHSKSRGIKANIECNRIWIVENKDNKELYLIGCENDYYVKTCEEGYKIILKYEEEIKNKITWYVNKEKYVQGRISEKCLLYIHQIIKGCYGNGHGTMNISVDHIDRDPLNNCFDNLRIATREEQEANTKSADGERRERKHNAKPLPEGITNDMMKKYVVYYREKYGNNHSIREFFKIEKHPKLDKSWIGSKSNKVSILDKLKAANDMIDSINSQNDDNNLNDN